jgi:hypothetical protein
MFSAGSSRRRRLIAPIEVSDQASSSKRACLPLPAGAFRDDRRAC